MQYLYSCVSNLTYVVIDTPTKRVGYHRKWDMRLLLQKYVEFYDVEYVRLSIGV